MTAAGNPSVFIVDDDASVRAAIQGLLKSVGLRSVAFATPQEFLVSERAEGPACLVLDVRLPGVSGLDFQRKLTEAGVQVPVIFITGYGDIPMSVKAMKSGAVEFLTKPFGTRTCSMRFSRRWSATAWRARTGAGLRICKRAAVC